MTTIARWTLVALSTAGFAFCLLNAFGADLACFTQGCQIYSSYEFLGISFYVYGAIAFGLLGVLAFFSTRSRLAAAAFAMLVIAALLADTAFLFYQFLFWPCASCMVVALLLGLIAIVALVLLPWLRHKAYYGIIGLWLFFFIIIAVEIAQEIYLPPWAAYGPENAIVSVYVSPSCSACRELMSKLTSHPDLMRQSAIYLIAKDAAEERSIAHYLHQLREGANDFQALQNLFTQEPPADAAPMSWQEKLRLQANTMAMARMGAASIPLVIAPGIMEIPVVQEAAPGESIPASTGIGTLQDLLNRPASSGGGGFGFSAGCSLLNPTEECPDTQDPQ
ncbi:hypothetical protein LGV61_00825 [Desulfurispirillum indicum]|uniref:hypothetical protein n=1 Tax=Desulfurispirillum indicum TaxID=936456 RepID=UPI001CFC29D2|nr:hypothetical protein [Desulfurispirillum indicum]UCZ56846.1 hypothetical protein LGV61_00825 [Desulfurispirillum indicum]